MPHAPHALNALLCTFALSACTSSMSPAPQAQPVPAYTKQSTSVLERVTTGVPWPRGIVWHEGKLMVLARGVHRSAGGPQPDIDDLAGSIFEVDPNVFETVVKGTAPTEAVRRNGRIIVTATTPPFRFWDRRTPPTLDTLTDRPYAGLILDPESRNAFVLAYSGIDLKDAPAFRKNASDAIHRFNFDTKRWYPFEAHDPSVVPESELGLFVPNDTYPHSDPAKTPPPHGLANGPCGASIVGDFLYVTAKENSALIQYPLAEVRRNPDAGPPRGNYIFRREGPQGDIFLQTKGHGNMYVEGPGAVVAHDGYMYVAFRTTSQVMRFPVTKNGDVVKPIVAEYLAQFDAYQKEGEGYTRSADFFDLRVNHLGEVFISCNAQGTIWKIPTDGSALLDARKGTTEKPYVNLNQLTDHEKSSAGNFCFDPQGNMYICTDNKDAENGKIRGVIYRVPVLR